MKNPPAFPTNQYANGISPSGFDTGMTLRDYFAAKAMQVILQSQYEDGIYVGDKDGSYFNLEGEVNERLKEDGRKLGQDIPSNGTSDLLGSRPRCKCNCQCSSRISLA